MFNLEKFKSDIYAKEPLESHQYKNYVIEIEEYLLTCQHFPSDLFQVYLYMLSSVELIQTHGIYRFFKGLYFDFDQLSTLQKLQLRKTIERNSDQLFENNLDFWLQEIMHHKLNQ